MKKKTKIILSCILGVAVLGGVAIAVGAKSNTMLAGAIVEGTGEYEWRKHEVHIKINSPIDEVTEYYSNENDYIYDLYYHTIYGNSVNSSETGPQARITFEQSFNWSDDLKVFFVIADHDITYTTSMVVCNLPWYTEEINVSYPGMTDDAYIKEIWIKTVD